MDLDLFLALLLLVFHLLPLYSFSCPYFDCGNLGNISFPFFNSTYPTVCGLCMINCDNKSSPKVSLGIREDNRFEAKTIDMSNSVITIHDLVLQQHLDNRRCESLDFNTTVFNSAFISYTIKQNITLFRCTANPENSQNRSDLFTGYGYDDDTCKPSGDIIYYPKPHTREVPSNEANKLGCTALHLPTGPEHENSENPGLFELLTAEFDLQWHLSTDCDITSCDSEEHTCPPDWRDESSCPNAEKGKKKLKVILATVIPGVAFIILVMVVLVIWRRKKGINGVFHFLSRTTSEPSSKPDLEGGSVYFGVPVFSYTELEEATNRFEASKELGDGGFGTVYYGKLRDGREVAVKRLYEHNFKRMEQFMNEIEILTRLRHRNLVTLYGCTSRRSRELLLVYEYIPNGTVADHLHGDRAHDKYLTWSHRMNIAIETADALAYLHNSDIIHRDIKTNNILLDHNFCVKVADFGLSRLFPTDVSHISTAPQGTPGYVDPEYHQCYQLTDKSDVYSFGVVLIELISSMPAVDISRHRHEINLANLAINRIQRCAFDELIDPSLGYKSDAEIMKMTTSVAELAFRCLQLEKEMRPSMQEVSETLKDIQDSKDILVDDTNETNEEAAESRNRMVPHSPESEDIVLLENVKFPSSPNSVADIWVSSSTTTSTSR